MNILLIAGGWSSEREVSLSGARAVRNALESLGHTVTPHDPAESLQTLAGAVEDKDFAFIMLHGSPGEDGILQALLERFGCAYQGAGPAASMLAIHKSLSKVLFTRGGLYTPPWQILHSLPEKGWRPALPFPLFVKADTGGSSLHMARVTTPEDLTETLAQVFAANKSCLLESAVDGAEITCGVLAGLDNDKEIPHALPPLLIKPSSGLVFTYASKYSQGGAEEICPAPISPELTRRIQEMTLTAHRLLGISGYSRADFIVPSTGEPVLLEVNTLPGMTATSLLPQETAAIGLSFAQTVQRLIDLGLARKQREGW